MNEGMDRQAWGNQLRLRANSQSGIYLKVLVDNTEFQQSFMSPAASAVFTAHLHNVKLLQSYLTSPPVLSTHVHAHSISLWAASTNKPFFTKLRPDNEHLFVFSWKIM